MRVLLDTHALLWWLDDDARLGQVARAHLAEPGNDILVSVVSLWEIVIKVRIGKLEADIVDIQRAMDRDGLARLAITPSHLVELARLPIHHRDPFDHLLVAQARCEGAVMISDDRAIPLYPIKVLACADT